VGGGGLDCFGWRFGVSLRLDGDVGWFILVTLSGLSSCLEHGGHQMLGSSNRRLPDPEHRGGGKCEGVGL
jgi:hypothetical protein